MKERIEDNMLIELLDLLIEYRKSLKSENETIHIGIKTQAGALIKYIDNEGDARNTIKSLKKLLRIDEENKYESSSM